MKDAQTNKRIDYHLGYSNFSFELWMVLHKKDCNGPLSHRSQYLLPINQIFGENFEDLDHYKAHDAFHRCLAKLTLDDVKAAIRRAETITRNNKRDGKTLLQLLTENSVLFADVILRQVFIDIHWFAHVVLLIFHMLFVFLFA